MSHKNKEAAAAYMREWHKNNRAHTRQMKLEASRRRRKAVLALLGGRCMRCGFDDPRALQVDHVHDDGYEERHAEKNHYRKMIAKILRGEELDRYQLLCANCNWIKRAEREGTFG